MLLRHRRRCHPTPPPADRSSHSPIPTQRAYPGVPVSSSRHDDYSEFSPDITGRKHPRDSVGSNGDRSTRPRLEEDEEEDDGQFGEGSRFARQNGMGNGGVYGANSFYPNESDPSYTPHLLPMFQNTNVFQQPEQEHHLEDASVLLSMAYPTGMPGNENGTQANDNNNNGHDDVSDWETGQQTINMMMEQAGVDTSASTLNQNESSGDGTANTSNDTSPALVEPINYMGSMSWLDGHSGKEGSGGLNGWVRIFISSLCKLTNHSLILPIPTLRHNPCLHSRSPRSSRLRPLACRYRQTSPNNSSKTSPTIAKEQ